MGLYKQKIVVPCLIVLRGLDVLICSFIFRLHGRIRYVLNLYAWLRHLPVDRWRLAPISGGRVSAHSCGASMAGSTLQPTPPLAADGAALSHVLQWAGVTKESVVRVTGPAGPTAVLWLCRHRYKNAAYVPLHWVAAMAATDALLIPQACAPSELSRILQDGACVREGGVLIVQTPPEKAVDAVLEPLGYEIEQHLSDKGCDVCIARRRGSGGFRKAA
jgi:hypothetical protein